MCTNGLVDSELPFNTKAREISDSNPDGFTADPNSLEYCKSSRCETVMSAIVVKNQYKCGNTTEITSIDKAKEKAVNKCQ